MNCSLSALISFFRLEQIADNSARLASRLCVEVLEGRALPTIFAPTGPLVQSLASTRNWISYSPSMPFNPDQSVFPSEAALRVDLQQLFNEGWRGLVTYSMDGTLREIPRIAKEVGFSQVIAGLFWFDDAQLSREHPAALQEATFIDGFVVGNEGLYFNHYSRSALEGEIASLRAVTGKPVTTTEIDFEYANDPSLLRLGDWAFPTSQTWFAPLAIRDPAQAVAHVASVYQGLQSLASDRTVIIKESWWPTDGNLYGEPVATQANQVSFYQQLAGTPVHFIWGEAYDQFWKTAEGTQGPHWGFHTAARVPKAIVSALQPIYTDLYPTPPVPVPAGLTVSAGVGGQGHVKTYAATGTETASFIAYPGYTGIVRTAIADVNADGVLDTITGTAQGADHVKVFDGRNGTLLFSFLSFGGFSGGVDVAGGDVDGDGHGDIIVGAGPGTPGGHVKVFSGATGAGIHSFFGFQGFTAGVRVGSGDLNHDGCADILVGTATGGSHVKGFDGRTGAPLVSFLAFGPNVGGIDVSAGDIDGDGFAEIFVSTGPGVSSAVRVFSPNGGARLDFSPYGGFTGGVSVGSITSGSRALVVTGAGPGGPPHVKGFDGLLGTNQFSFFAYDPSFEGGVFVA